MRARFVSALIVSALFAPCRAADQAAPPLPLPAKGWSIELAALAPQILFPTAIAAAPDGTVYLGSDPMDMPGPPTAPIDKVVSIKDGKISVFADQLWSVMGLEWEGGTLYVVHAPFLSAFRDADGDGKADSRVDLMTGLGPRLPGFNGINDHVASGIRLGMDGFLYIAVGDKGIPHGVGRDKKTIQLAGGGVIRIRPDGSDLEVVSTGECNPLSVALSATDEIFSYGNDDDSKKWPNSLTHHIVGGHYGFPYQFQSARSRALPIVTGQTGGIGAQGICYNEDGLPAEYRGNLFFCDWGLQTVFRYEIRKSGGTHALTARTPLVSRGELNDFRPFSLAVANDGASLWLVDWAYTGWLVEGPRTGRLYRLRYTGSASAPAARPSGSDAGVRIKALDHPALAVRLESQRMLARMGPAAVPLLIARLKTPEPAAGRLHALWALDSIGGEPARSTIVSMLRDPAASLRLQAARSAGIRGDRSALLELSRLLGDRDPAVRRESAIALGKLGMPVAAAALYASLGDADTFAAWSVRWSIRRLGAWDKDALVAALLDERRLEPALRLTDEAWAPAVVAALKEALDRTPSAPVRARIVANLAGLYRQYPEWSGTWFGTDPLAGPFPQKTKDWSPAAMAEVLDGLSQGLADASSSVRFQAIMGLRQAGPIATPRLRSALVRETDPANQAILVKELGAREDMASLPVFASLLADSRRPEEVRTTALGALTRLRDPRSIRIRLNLVYDDKTPAPLVAAALPDLARSGILPVNDLFSFLQNPSPDVRSAALLSVNVKGPLPVDCERSVLEAIEEESAQVRQAAMLAAGSLRLRPAIPKLMAAAAQPGSPHRTPALAALCMMPDPQAIPAYLTAIEDQNPQLRKAGEWALLAIRDQAGPAIKAAAQSRAFSGPASLSLSRVLSHFEPVIDWRLIGPFPRTNPQLFFGDPSIDFSRTFAGADGRSLRWSTRRAEPVTGRVLLDDLKQAMGGSASFEASRSPDLCAFAYAEVDSSRDRQALMLVGSSGTAIVSVNETPVYQFKESAGRAYAPDTDIVSIDLKKGINRLLVLTRQGMGAWSFGIQIARSDGNPAARIASDSSQSLRRFALAHAGDPTKGQAIFFNPQGVGCVHCHAAAGRGTATIGPDLTGLASKYDRAEVIRSILEPSSRIAHGFQPTVIATRDGRVLQGQMRAESDQSIDLAGADARITRIPKSDIEVRRTGDVSTMPARSVEGLSPADFADLIAFLMSLKSAPAVPARSERPSIP